MLDSQVAIQAPNSSAILIQVGLVIPAKTELNTEKQFGDSPLPRNISIKGNNKADEL